MLFVHTVDTVMEVQFAELNKALLKLKIIISADFYINLNMSINITIERDSSSE